MEAIQQFIPNFFFVLIRTGIVLSLLPVFGSKTFPPQFRIGLIVAFSALLAPIVVIPATRMPMVSLIMREVLFGIVFGGAARAIFYAVDMAGQVMASVTGISMASTFSPDLSASTEISRMYSIIAMLIFLSMDIHHDLIQVLVKSFELFTPGQFDVSMLVISKLFSGAGLFVLVLKLSAPVVIIMLVTNIILGFISKAAPQMNVFFVGYPVYLFLGFLTMLISLPVFAAVLGTNFSGIKDEIHRVMLLIRG